MSKFKIDKDKLKKYLHGVFLAISIVGILCLIIQLGGNNYFDFKCDECGEYWSFESTLLQLYIFVITSLSLIYYLYPVFIKNFLNRKKILYTIMVLQTPVISILLDIIFNALKIHNRSIKFYKIPIMLAAGAAIIIVAYFIEREYYKHINKKLSEYKQKSDDEIEK